MSTDGGALVSTQVFMRVDSRAAWEDDDHLTWSPDLDIKQAREMTWGKKEGESMEKHHAVIIRIIYGANEE